MFTTFTCFKIFYVKKTWKSPKRHKQICNLFEYKLSEHVKNLDSDNATVKSCRVGNHVYGPLPMLTQRQLPYHRLVGKRPGMQWYWPQTLQPTCPTYNTLFDKILRSISIILFCCILNSEHLFNSPLVYHCTCQRLQFQQSKLLTFLRSEWF